MEGNPQLAEQYFVLWRIEEEEVTFREMFIIFYIVILFAAVSFSFFGFSIGYLTVVLPITKFSTIWRRELSISRRLINAIYGSRPSSTGAITMLLFLLLVVAQFGFLLLLSILLSLF